jgi:UDP-N-acetylmuramate dehydrogenase
MTSKYDFIYPWLDTNEIKHSKDYKVSSKSWLKAGGIIKNFITPENTNDCIKILKFFKQNNIKYYILGNISNIIIRDGNIFTPIINLQNLSNIKENKINNELILTVNAGTSMTKFSKFVSNKGFTGSEGLVGIPGSVGGGIVMNAGSYGSCISDFLTSVECLDVNGELINLNKNELHFNFRKSIFQKSNFFILNAIFNINKKENIGNDKTSSKMNKIIFYRTNTQEKKLPNLGSIFSTMDLYKDLKNKNIYFYLSYYLYKFYSFLVYKFSNKNFDNSKKIFVNFYIFLLKLDTTKGFSLSERTINSLVNKGSLKADDAINLVKDMQLKIGNCAKLENIILDDIE